MILNDITGRIGNTSIVRLNRLTKDLNGEIFAKVEFSNPGGSVKDRIAKSMIEEAEKCGKLKPGDVIIEPTSGNTGIGLAMVAAAKQYRIILTMPDTMSIERRKILQAYGAELVLTPGSLGMKGAIEKANELVEAKGSAFSPGQFVNPANPAAHEFNTGPEIMRDIDCSRIDAFIFGVGTGGTLTGVGRCLRKNGIDAPIIAVEPEGSPVLSGGKPGPHKIQGIGAGFIPQILDTALISSVIQVSNEEAMETARELAKEEGLFVGISSGAAVAACLKYIRKSNSSRKLRILTLFPSNGERYLSTELFAHLT
ncbi:MAG: cysteine synthase A [Candidatus Rifleibacteriota bacterium]